MEPAGRGPAPGAQGESESEPAFVVTRRGMLISGILLALAGISLAAYVNTDPADAPDRPEQAPVIARGRIVSRVPGLDLGREIEANAIRVLVIPQPFYQATMPTGVRVGVEKSGEFVIRGNWKGHAILSTNWPEGYKAVEKPVGPIDLPTEVSIEIELVPGVAITGRVVHEGRPVAGAKVVVGATQALEFSRSCYRVAVSDAQGRFMVPHFYEHTKIYAGLQLGSARDLAVVRPVEAETGASGESLDLGDLALERGYRIAGKIVPGGRPMPLDCSVRIDMDWPYGWLGFDISRVDGNGRFEFGGIPQGIVRISLDGRWPGERVRPGQMRLDRSMPGTEPEGALGLVGKVEQDVLDLKLVPDFSTRPLRPPSRDALARFEQARTRPIGEVDGGEPGPSPSGARTP